MWLIILDLDSIYIYNVLTDVDIRAEPEEGTNLGRSDAVISDGMTQQTQNICITFVQRWTNVEDVGRRCTNVI